MSKQLQEALDLCVRAIDNPADINLINAALLTSRPLLQVPTYPRQVADHIIQYGDNAFIWYDEAGLAGGAAETLEDAQSQLTFYSECLENLHEK